MMYEDPILDDIRAAKSQLYDMARRASRGPFSDRVALDQINRQLSRLAQMEREVEPPPAARAPARSDGTRIDPPRAERSRRQDPCCSGLIEVTVKEPRTGREVSEFVPVTRSPTAPLAWLSAFMAPGRCVKSVASRHRDANQDRWED
jgi:hypothetical protein